MEVRKSNQKEERKGEKVIGGSEKEREREKGEIEGYRSSYSINFIAQSRT